LFVHQVFHEKDKAIACSSQHHAWTWVSFLMNNRGWHICARLEGNFNMDEGVSAERLKVLAWELVEFGCK
jgi:hypothetical protein